jgi:hypothetical protein
MPINLQQGKFGVISGFPMKFHIQAEHFAIFHFGTGFLKLGRGINIII